MIDVIFSQLLVNQDYFTRVWPYMDQEYFEKGPARNLFNSIKKHIDQYNTIPTKTALKVALDNQPLSEVDLSGAKKLLNSLSEEKESTDWLVQETENFVKNAAVYNATARIIEIQTNAELPPEKQNKHIPAIGAIPEIMQKAVSISFDNYVGHDWIDDYEARWMSYQNKTRKVPFKLNILNRITKGGVENATLNLILGGTNVGKSLGLCSLAAEYMQTGQNVLYISMEMSEEVCAKRIDANLLDVTLDEIDDGQISYAEYKAKMEKWRANNSLGKLVIKQYGTGSANANTFRALLNELKLKKNFKPDVIMIDYLGICASARIKQYTENSYTLVKAIAEEVRALAFEANCPIWSAAQTTRNGGESSDITMADIAESYAILHTCDFVLAVLETPELAAKGVQLFKQLKSRYGDKNYINKFELGIRKGNQKWVEIEQSQYLQAEHDMIKEASNTQVKQANDNKESAISKRAQLDALADSLLEDCKF